MPRASLLQKDMGKSGFVREGNFEILACIVACFQFPQKEVDIKAGKAPSDPVIAYQLHLGKLNEDLNRIDDVEEIVTLPMLWPRKAHKDGPALKDNDGNFVFPGCPANAKNMDDMEPAELGTLIEGDVSGYAVEVGSEGNCLSTVPDYKLWDEAPASRFFITLGTLGIKPEILGSGYGPALVGAKIHVKTIELPKSPGWTKAEPPTALVCDKIHVHPSAPKAAGKGAAAGKSTTAKSGKSNGAAVEAPVAAAPVASSGKVDAGVAAFKKSNSGKTLTRAEFTKGLTLALMGATVPMKETQAFVNPLKQDAALMEFAMEHELELNDDGSEITVS